MYQCEGEKLKGCRRLGKRLRGTDNVDHVGIAHDTSSLRVETDVDSSSINLREKTISQAKALRKEERHPGSTAD